MDPLQPSTDPVQPPPRRRRWLRRLAILVVVLGAFATWWNWPREDARFCGRWACIDALTGATTGECKLFRNGRGRLIEADGVQQWLLRWHCDGEQLVLGRSLSRTFEDQVEQVAYWVIRVTGRSLLTVELRMQVLEVHADRIRLREIRPSGREVTLRRIAE